MVWNIDGLLLCFDRFCRRHRLRTGENVPSIPRDLLLMSEMVLPRFIMCIIQYLRDGYIEPGEASPENSPISGSQVWLCLINQVEIISLSYYDVLFTMLYVLFGFKWLMMHSLNYCVYTGCQHAHMSSCWRKSLILPYQTAQLSEISRKSCSSWNLRSHSWRSSQRWGEQWGLWWQRSWQISKHLRSCAWVKSTVLYSTCSYE